MATVFTFEGQTGAVNAKSVYDANLLNARTTPAQRLSGYSFHISFEIPDKDLPLHVVDREALSAIRDYAQAATQPPKSG